VAEDACAYVTVSAASRQAVDTVYEWYDNDSEQRRGLTYGCHIAGLVLPVPSKPSPNGTQRARISRQPAHNGLASSADSAARC